VKILVERKRGENGDVEVIDLRQLKKINALALSRRGRAELIADRYKIDEETCRLYLGLFNLCPSEIVHRLVRNRIIREATK